MRICARRTADPRRREAHSPSPNVGGKRQPAPSHSFHKPTPKRKSGGLRVTVASQLGLANLLHVAKVCRVAHVVVGWRKVDARFLVFRRGPTAGSKLKMGRLPIRCPTRPGIVHSHSSGTKHTGIGAGGGATVCSLLPKMPSWTNLLGSFTPTKL